MNIPSSALRDIHPGAKIGSNVHIGPFTVIEEDVVIGDNCRIGSNVHIFNGARIGDGVQIFPFSSISATPQSIKKEEENFNNIFMNIRSIIIIFYSFAFLQTYVFNFLTKYSVKNENTKITQEQIKSRK